MPPASRITDMHVCPMVTGIVPHVGGPILPPGAPTVLIGFLPAATVTTMATCVGPPDVIVKGSMGVMINFLPAARIGDLTAHGGVIILGEPTVIIGEIGGGGAGGGGGVGGMVAGIVSFFSAIGSFLHLPGMTSQPAGDAKLNAIVNAVNPTGSTVNCGNIIDAEVARLQGSNPNAVAPATGNGSFAQIEQRFNTKIAWGQGFQNAFDAVKAGGDGAIAIVGVQYSGGTASHVLVMANDHGTVGILEAQDWGPGNPKEVIASTSQANQRYNSDGGSNIGYGLLPK